VHKKKKLKCSHFKIKANARLDYIKNVGHIGYHRSTRYDA